MQDIGKNRLFVIQAETEPGEYREVRPFLKLSEAVAHINNRIGGSYKYTQVHHYIVHAGQFFFYHPATKEEYRLTMREIV
jgi:hypothetical protein